MIELKDDFLRSTKMRDANGRLVGVEEIFDFLIEPQRIYKMILASDFHFPALTFIAKELEDSFGENSLFPVVKTKNNENATNRQNVGRMVKVILEALGYSVCATGLSAQARMPNYSQARHFSTCSVYAKNPEIKAKYKVELLNFKVEKIEQ